MIAVSKRKTAAKCQANQQHEIVVLRKLNKDVHRCDRKRDKFIFLNAAAICQLPMVSMVPLKKSSRKRTKTPPRARVRTYVAKLLMYSVFSAAVASITPAITSVNAEIIAVVPKEIGHTSKKHLDNRDGGSNYYGYRETPPPGYYGNWGYAPGGYYWDPNYQWRRSLGFWDTNSPACPFRSC